VPPKVALVGPTEEICPVTTEVVGVVVGVAGVVAVPAPPVVAVGVVAVGVVAVGVVSVGVVAVGVVAVVVVGAAWLERAATPFCVPAERLPVLPEPGLEDAPLDAAPPEPPPDDDPPPPLGEAMLEAELPAVPAVPADEEVPDDEEMPDEAPPAPDEGNGRQLRFWSLASWAFAVTSVAVSVTSCCWSVVTASWACCKLDVFESRWAAVRPLLAVESALSACARFACAESKVFCALVGSTVASIWPALTWSPAATSTAVSVPLVPKLTDAELATPTLPDALTLDCTMPRVTVAVRCEALVEGELLKNP